jgi:hypothetical protein
MMVRGMGKGDRKMISLPIIPLTMIPLTNFVENDWFSQIASQPQPNSRKFGRGMFGRGMRRKAFRIIPLPIITLPSICPSSFCCGFADLR